MIKKIGLFQGKNIQSNILAYLNYLKKSCLFLYFLKWQITMAREFQANEIKDFAEKKSNFLKLKISKRKKKSV